MFQETRFQVEDGRLAIMTTRAQALAILIGNETILTGHKSRPLRSLHHYPKPRDSIVKVIRWNEVCVPSATCLEISKRTARRRSGRRCPEIATKPAIDFENVTPMGNIDRHAFSSQRQYTSSVGQEAQGEPKGEPRNSEDECLHRTY